MDETFGITKFSLKRGANIKAVFSITFRLMDDNEIVISGFKLCKKGQSFFLLYPIEMYNNNEGRRHKRMTVYIPNKSICDKIFSMSLTCYRLFSGEFDFETWNTK